MPVVLLIIGHLFLATSLGDRAKLLWLVAAAASVAAHLATPWVVRYGGGRARIPARDHRHRADADDVGADGLPGARDVARRSRNRRGSRTAARANRGTNPRRRRRRAARISPDVDIQGNALETAPCAHCPGSRGALTAGGLRRLRRRPTTRAGNVLLARREQLHDDGQPLDPDGRDHRRRPTLDICWSQRRRRSPVPPGVGAPPTSTTCRCCGSRTCRTSKVADPRRRGHAVAVGRRRVPRLPHRSQRTTCTKLSELSFFGTVIDVPSEYIESADYTYLLLFAKGTTPGQGARTMMFLNPTAASTNTAVDAPTGCGHARLLGRPRVADEAGGPGGGALDPRLARHHARRAGERRPVPEDRRRHDRLLRRDDRRRSAGADLRHRADRHHAVGHQAGGRPHRRPGAAKDRATGAAFPGFDARRRGDLDARADLQQVPEPAPRCC